MYKLYPYFTNDGSVGLFSPDADDIYHSTSGALSEAYEKFILPANFQNFFQKNSDIKILDICFGIGYNSKSFLNNFLDILYNETIGTDNIKYNDKIGDDNKNNKKQNISCHSEPKNIMRSFAALRMTKGEESHKNFKIFIKAIDTDKNLAGLSPFFIADKKIVKDNKLSFEQDKIRKLLSTNAKPKYKFRKEVNILLLEKLINLIDNDVEDILTDKNYSQFFDGFMVDFYRIKKNERINNTPLRRLNAFLHNIYYKYISTSHKNALKALKLLDFNFEIKIDDARKVIQEDKNLYDFVFLDAFTATKCPCLWTVDFFKALYEHLQDGGMILTYSNSAQVRHAFLEAGFWVGKNVFDGKSIGTVAVKITVRQTSPLAGEGADVSELANVTPAGEGSILSQFPKISPLSQYDLGLLKTKAGIFYRDENLNLPNEAIIAAHRKEVENSTLMSSSKYKKMQ